LPFHLSQALSVVSHSAPRTCVTLALDNHCSPSYNRNVEYVTINEMSRNGTQTPHTRPTDTRTSPRRSPPAVSSAGLPGDERRCNLGRGRHFLKGNPVPALCQQGGSLRRCPESPHVGAAGLCRETGGLACASRPAIAAPGAQAALPRDTFHDEPAWLPAPGAHDYRRITALPAAWHAVFLDCHPAWPWYAHRIAPGSQGATAHR